MAFSLSRMRPFSKKLHGSLESSKTLPSPSDDEAERIAVSKTLPEHWADLKAAGFTASEIIKYLQPIADLEGISVSYWYKDEGGHEHVYNHKRDDPSYDNPLSQAIREKKLSKERALQFALNEEGRTWIESNFMEIK